MPTSVSASRSTKSPRRAAASQRRILWHGSAPSTVRSHERWDDQSDGWLAWVQHLQSRRLESIADLYGDSAALTWGAGGEPTAHELMTTLSRMLKKRGDGPAIESMAATWLTESPGMLHDARYAGECLAWAYLLPRLASVLTAGTWWKLLEHLSGASSAAAAANPDHNPWPQQLLGVELGLVLANELPEIESCRSLGTAAVKCQLEGFDKLLGKDSIPSARRLSLVRPLLACWTRATMLGRRLDDLEWPDELKSQYVAFLLNALRLCRRDGSQSLSAGKQRDRQLFEAALAVADDEPLRRVASSLTAVIPTAESRKPEPVLPPTGFQSDRAELGVLRSDWTRDHALLTATYSDLTVNCELHVAGDTLWSGVWGLDVRVDGVPRPIDSPWDNVCWVSDDDVDYLELQAQLRGGLKVQRLMLLARKHRFAFLADAILGREPGHIEYRGTLPLAASAKCTLADETREASLAVGKLRARVLPLALPEWRRDPRGGSLTAAADGLELQQSRDGVRLFAPLWIDFDPRRARQALTWRQLTVAEDRKVQSPDVAVGYRVQIGKQQWLIYRSLGPRGNRTLLGSNLVSEFMLARFPPNGEADPLLEVE